MKRTLVSLTAAAALAAGTAMVPTQASAYPAWVIPAIIAGSVAGVGVGAAAAANAPRGAVTVVEQPGTVYGTYAAPAPVYAAPALGATTVIESPRALAPGCYFIRQRVSGVLRRVEVC